MNNPFTDVFCKHCGEFVNLIYGGDCPNCGERIPGIDNSYEKDTDDEDDDDIEEDDVLCPHCNEYVTPIFGGECPNCGEVICREED